MTAVNKLKILQFVLLLCLYYILNTETLQNHWWRVVINQQENKHYSWGSNGCRTFDETFTFPVGKLSIRFQRYSLGFCSSSDLDDCLLSLGVSGWSYGDTDFRLLLVSEQLREKPKAKRRFTQICSFKAKDEEKLLEVKHKFKHTSFVCCCFCRRRKCVKTLSKDLGFINCVNKIRNLINYNLTPACFVQF